MVKSFRDLVVWQKAMDLADAVYTATEGFPRNEIFGLTAQMRKAVVSIPSNIAEGRASGGGRYLYHLRIAIGSEAELQTQLELAARRAYLPADRTRVLLDQASEVGRMLHGLHNSLKTEQTRRRIIGLAVLLILASAARLLA